MKLHYVADEALSDDARDHTGEVTKVYLAAEVDAEIADMRAGFALVLKAKDARIKELNRALRMYGGHLEMCACLGTDGMVACDCGLVRALGSTL